MTLQRKNEPGGRQIMYTIRLSEPEQKALQVKANARGVKISRFLLEAAFGHDDEHQAKIWRTELQGLRRQVAESGCTPELEAAIRDLLRRISG